MRTAQEMLDYCIENDLGHHVKDTQIVYVSYFDVIAKYLKPNENVLLAFSGSISEATFIALSAFAFLSNYAFALTDQRILIGRKAVFFGGEFFFEIPLSNLVGINMHVKNVTAFVLFDTITEKFKVNMWDIDIANRVIHECNEIMGTYATPTAPEHARNPLDDIRQLKELLDMGAITQEEFDTKKEKLLDLYKQSI